MLVVCAVLLGAGCGDATSAASPPTLRVGHGQPYLAMMLGTRMALPVTLHGPDGGTLPLPQNFTLASREPGVASVDSGTVVRARAMGRTWLVGSVVADGRPLADSLEVAVVCTMELGIELTPPTQALAVGQSFTPTVRLIGCGGQLTLSDTIRWSADDPAIVRVDAVSGLTTAIGVGQTVVRPRGVRYGQLPGVFVTVTGVTP